MKSVYEILGGNIRNLRKSMGWSQAVLAEKADIAVSYMTMIELGQRSASLEVVQIIARIFGIPVSVLFEETIKPEEVFLQNQVFRIDKFGKNLMQKIQKVVEESISELQSEEK